MFNKIAKRIAGIMILKKAILEDKGDCYAYGIEIVFLKFTFYLISFIICILTRTIFPGILFLFIYMTLRQYTGGFHCKSAEICLIFSIGLFALFVYVYKYSTLKHVFLLIPMLVASYVVIYVRSPIESENKPLSKIEKNKYKRVSQKVVSVYMIIVCIGLLLKCTFVYYPIMLAIIADGLMIIIVKPKARRCNNVLEYDRKNS